VVVGILYAREPEAFAPAVADLLRDGDWVAVVQVAPLLRSGPRPVPETVIGAVLDRVRRAGPEVGEPDLVSLLADLAPDRIGSESWSGMCGWPTRVRASLAEAIGRGQSPDDLDRRVNLGKRVSCWLWRSPRTDLVDLDVWGGWCAEEAFPTGMQTLRIPGRQRAAILVARAIWGRGPTYFVGNGPYPDPVS
jgi:hypothetical protein